MKLFHKGLILVAVPLLFEFLFVGTLWHLLQEVEQERQRETEMRAVSARLNKLHRMVLSAVSTAAMYPIMLIPSRQSPAKALTEEMKSIEEMLKDKPEQRDVVMNLHRIGENGAQQILEAQEMARHDGTSMIDKLRNTKKLAAELSSGFNTIMEQEEALVSQAPRIEAEKRALIKNLLLLGLVFNVLLALVLVYFFTKSTTSRLAVVMDNTQRLASGKELNKPVQGKDEIAKLDTIFRQMSDQLRAAEAHKQDLLNMVTHDLRSPLTSVRGALNLLAAGAFGEQSDEAKTRLGTADRNLDRLISLINDLLDIEKMKAGMLEMKCIPTDLQDIFFKTSDAVTDFAEQLDINLKFPQNTCTVNADPERLVQVMVNLVGNAIKFSPAKGTVEVSLNEAQDHVEVRIKDEGPGIPKGELANIFERFSQVKREDTGKIYGSGLGLPICKTIIELHKGKIGIESQEGKGSTFWFRLPKV